MIAKQICNSLYGKLKVDDRNEGSIITYEASFIADVKHSPTLEIDSASS